MKIYLICPVRKANLEDTTIAEGYVAELEASGHEVYWPQRDTVQDDPTGVDICIACKDAVEWCDRVDVIWSDKSEGKLFDLALAFMAEKPLRLVSEVPFVEGKKSYASVVNHWPWGVELWDSTGPI